MDILREVPEDMHSSEQIIPHRNVSFPPRKAQAQTQPWICPVCNMVNSPVNQMCANNCVVSQENKGARNDGRQLLNEF